MGAMVNRVQYQEGVPENLRRQLAVAVRSVQWSYAIFWSLSARQEGVLECEGGCYNGDVKTRKMVQGMELEPNGLVLQRSEQLRELYERLLKGEPNQQAKKASAALSPDDLTDVEWYYLVCMSFVFDPGQGLPGRSLATGQSIWLCNAHSADFKVFSHSLLAKTVICFPYFRGVIEIGVAELVPADPSLIQHIKVSLLEFSKPICSEKSSSIPYSGDDDTDCAYTKFDHEMANTTVLDSFHSPRRDTRSEDEKINKFNGNIEDDLSVSSPDDCSDGCEHHHQSEDSFPIEGIDGGSSEV